MNLETPKSKVYIQTDTDGRILRCEGGYTTPANQSDVDELPEALTMLLEGVAE